MKEINYYIKNKNLDNMQFQCIFQILTALFCLYSFIRWKSDSSDNDNDIHISYVLSCLLLIFLFPLIFILLFENFNDDYIDLELTALSTLATLLLYRKNVIAWVIWLITDFGFIVSSVLQNNNTVTLVYVVLFVLAFYGFIRNYNLALKNDNNRAFDDIEFLLNLK